MQTVEDLIKKYSLPFVDMDSYVSGHDFEQYVHIDSENGQDCLFLEFVDGEPDIMCQMNDEGGEHHRFLVKKETHLDLVRDFLTYFCKASAA